MAAEHGFTKINRVRVYEKMSGLNWSYVNNELDTWKEGQNGYLVLKKIGKLKSPEELGYYYSVILPEAFKAIRESGELTVTVTLKSKTLELPLEKKTVDILLKWRYGKWKGEYKDKGDMNMAECADFMDWCIKWLAKWYNCHIPEADKNWRNNKCPKSE